MKAYNEYMNKISVSGTLHQRVIFRVNNSRSERRPIMIKRYAAAFTCVAVVILGIITIPSVLQPGSITPTPSLSGKYTLDFNSAVGHVAANIHIPGHFWQELTAKEIKDVFPMLGNTHSIKASAHFQSDENGATLFNIDARAKSVSESESYIQIAPGEIVLDYVFDSETKSSDVQGTVVTAGYFETKPNSKGLNNIIYFATFNLSDVAYYVELGGAEADKVVLKNEISKLTGLLIEGGAADLDVFDPVVPELREERLSLDEARADVDFGAYLSVTLPDGFVFEDALRFINQEKNALFVNWRRGMGYINWRVSQLGDDDKTRITSIADTKNYDLALYPIPRADPVPDELCEIVDNPIFVIDDLILETVQSRTYEISDSGDMPDPQMQFSVVYGDILVEFNAKGVSAEAMFGMLQRIPK